MTAHGALLDGSGAPIDREGSTLLGRGGEARVWALPANGKALKLLEPHARTGARLRALEHLVRTPAPVLRGMDDEQPWGWPEDLVFENGACVGYTMRAFRQRRTLFSVLVPTERMRVFPAFDARHLHRVGSNLARALACLHDANIVVGDLSESNVLVGADASVAFVDVDSFQFVTTRGELLPCPVGKPELLAPEHHGEFFSTTPKTPASDAFSLAVLLFQILFDGPHPFSGVYRGAGACPTPAEALLAGDYVFAAESRLTPRLGMPGLAAVHPELAHAFERTFVAGLHRPELRTSVKTWAELLDRAELGLMRCSRNRAHLHPSAAPACAYCMRAEHFGRALETFAHVNTDELPPATKPSTEPTSVPTVASSAKPVEAVPEPIKRRAKRLVPRSRPASGRKPRRHEHAPKGTPDTPAPLSTRPAASVAPATPIAEQHPSDPWPESSPSSKPPIPNAPRVPRYAVVAAIVAAFAVGRCAAPESPSAQTTVAHVPAGAPTSTTTPPLTRGSAVLRRDVISAEKKAPRPPR